MEFASETLLSVLPSELQTLIEERHIHLQLDGPVTLEEATWLLTKTDKVECTTFTPSQGIASRISIDIKNEVHTRSSMHIVTMRQRSSDEPIESSVVEVEHEDNLSFNEDILRHLERCLFSLEGDSFTVLDSWSSEVLLQRRCKELKCNAAIELTGFMTTLESKLSSRKLFFEDYKRDILIYGRV